MQSTEGEQQRQEQTERNQRDEIRGHLDQKQGQHGDAAEFALDDFAQHVHKGIGGQDEHQDGSDGRPGLDDFAQEVAIDDSRAHGPGFQGWQPVPALGRPRGRRRRGSATGGGCNRP
jgi:hypothetical protein